MTPPTHPPQSQLPSLGRYQLVREIARSNDIVWEARDPQVNRRVAVKELALPPDLTGQPRRERIERFFREARAAGAMNHPNIVTIHEVGEDRGRFFIAMEYLEGQTLRDRISAVGALPLNDAIGIAAALSDALEYAHEHGIIHRDIKPENIHLLPDGRVKLTDFGIARIAGETQLTIAGQVFGTPSYMSPEQVVGREIDLRSDLFSLGVLLYEMLTGRKPFTTPGDNVVTITYRILHEPTPVAAGAGPMLDNVIQRATAKDPSQRYRSAADFRANLLAAAAPRPTTLPPAGSYAPETSLNPYGSPQNPTMVGSPTLFGSAAPPSASPSYPPAYPAPQYTPPASRSGRSVATIAIVLVVLSGVALGGGWMIARAYQNYLQGNKLTASAGSYNKGAALYQQGKYEEAAAIFKALRASGADAQTVQQSAQGELFCYRQLGHQAQDRQDLEGAQRWYQEALKIAPTDADAKSELDAVQKALLAGSVTTQVAPTATPAGSLPNALPNAPTPGARKVNQNDFNAANNQAASEAASLLQQGVDAYNSGDRDKAMNLWSQAAQAGPGSTAAQAALQYNSNLAQGKNPFDGSGGGG